MAKILQKDASILRATAEPVNPKDFTSPRLAKILDDMKSALDKEEDGVAIAAPQIGVPLRIFIVSHRAFEIELEEKDKINSVVEKTSEQQMPVDSKIKLRDMVFINPEIVKLSRKKVWVPEGCLSVRWLYGEVLRSDKATIRAYDENGKPFTYGGSGLLAQIFQHETDHLNGLLFIDTARDLEVITREDQERMRKEDAQKKGQSEKL
ncbi:MAG: peptide deformylase [Patescibacteria group bacterium]